MDTDDEAHRLACEARLVLSLPFAERKPYLERKRKRHGDAVARELEAEVRRQFEKTTGGKE